MTILKLFEMSFRNSNINKVEVSEENETTLGCLHATDDLYLTVEQSLV